MQITRIELHGEQGYATIQRPMFGLEVTIHSIKPGDDGEKTWTISTNSERHQILELAQIIQKRNDGFRGSNSMIHDYFCELQRFMD